MAAVIVAAGLLGAAVGRALPTKPEASLSAQGPSPAAQSPSPAAEPVVSYVNIRPQVVDQPVSEEHIPTF
jgi:hypothetical protein